MTIYIIESIFTEDFMNYKTIKYENENKSINVRFDEENNTIWLTQNEIALVLNKTKANISILIKKIITEFEQSFNEHQLSPGRRILMQ